MAKAGYYRLLAEDGTDVVIATPELTIGRGPNDMASGELIGDVLMLGHHKYLSRRHAVIRWSAVRRAWEIECLGKNGIHVNGQYVEPASGPIPLKTQSAVKMTTFKLFFLLPKK